MFAFLKSLFNPAPPSGNTAKERLRLVLLSDQLSLAPDVVVALKKDLLAVISRYVTIDFAHADVTFEHRENEVAMLASIPITGVRERGALESVPARPASAPEPLAAPQLADDVPVATPEAPPPGPPLAQPAASVAAAPASAAPTTAAPPKAATRRRRRKKASIALANAAERTNAVQPPSGLSAQA